MGSAITEQVESAQGPELKAALTRLSSEMKARFTKGSPTSYEFITGAIKTLSKLKGTSHADLRMRYLFDATGFLFANGHNQQALDCAKRLLALAIQVDDPKWLRDAHMLVGITAAYLGDFGEGLHEHFKALELAVNQQDPAGESKVLTNLGTGLSYAGLYREAIPYLERAAAVARNAGLVSNFECAALCNLAQAHLFLGEHERGMKWIARCLEISDEPLDAFQALSRSIREYTYVLFALELGKLEQARVHARACVAYAQRGGTTKSRFVAQVSVALCDIHGGDVQRGLDALELELSRCTERKGTDYLYALRALVRGYDHACRPEDALRSLQDLLRGTRDAREQGMHALLSPGLPPGAVVLEPEVSDLQELAVRESRLRAIVAEREVVSSRIEMLERLAVTADLKEEQSGEHGYRVGKLSALVAREMGWNPDACTSIELAARTHDIGKIGLPDRILLSSQELKAAERQLMSTHALIGAELLAKSNIPQLRLAEEIARHHHEWWNGEGYPSKLRGKRIPIHARIVALADVFDALTHGRPFANPWPMDQAIEEIRNRRGTQFDPELTDVFLTLLERLRNEHADLDEYLGRAGRNSPFLQARNRIRMMLSEERDQEKKATVDGNQTRH